MIPLWQNLCVFLIIKSYISESCRCNKFYRSDAIDKDCESLRYSKIAMSMSNRCILKTGTHHYDNLKWLQQCLMDASLSMFTFCTVAAFEKYNVFKAELDSFVYKQNNLVKNDRNLLARIETMIKMHMHCFQHSQSVMLLL
jgi:hypothetical protein